MSWDWLPATRGQLESLWDYVLSQTEHITRIGEVTMARVQELAARLNEATNEIARDLDDLRSRLAQQDEALAAELEPMVARLEQLGQEGTDDRSAAEGRCSAPAADHRMGQCVWGVDKMAARKTMSTMDERSLAEQIEASKGDPEAWGEPEEAPAKRRSSERRQRGAVVSVRLTAEELSRIQQYAEDTGGSLSGVLRDAALAAAEGSVRGMWHSAHRVGIPTTTASSAAEDSTFTTTSNGRLYEALASAR